MRFLGAILPEALEYLFMNKDPIVDKSIDFVKPGDYNKIQDVMMAKLWEKSKFKKWWCV